MMRRQIFLVVFTAAALAAGRAAHSLPRPSSVSVTCDSYKVEVHWEYPPQIQDVVFEVEVNGKNGRESSITRNHSINISDMLKSPAFSAYAVFVTARQGNKISERAESDTFSFNEHATSNIKCRLDFPEVTLSAEDGNLRLEFPNPLQLYRNTPALRNNTDVLKYFTWTSEHTELENICGVEFTTCHTSLSFIEEREEYCVNLTGIIGQRPLTERRECFYGDLKSYPHFTTYLYPVLGVVLTLLLITFIMMVLRKSCNERIKKKAMSAFPKILVIEPTQAPKPLKMEPENFEPVTCDEKTTELHTLMEVSSSTAERTDGSAICPEQYSGYAEEDDDDDDEDELEENRSFSDSTETGNMFYNVTKSSSGLSSGYDCPHCDRQEMSPGDLVEVYRS